MSEPDDMLLCDLNFPVDIIGANNIIDTAPPPAMCEESVPSSVQPSKQSSKVQPFSQSEFSLHPIQEIKANARSATDFCTKVMRFIFKQEELNGKVVGSKKENSVEQERLNLIQSLYSAYYERGEPQWQEWSKCLAAMNAHIRKYINK